MVIRRVSTGWKPAFDVSIKWNNSNEPCEAPEYKQDHDEWEFATNKNPREYGRNVAAHSLKWSRQTSVNATAPTNGDIVVCTYSDGHFTYTGKARIMSHSREVGGKGGYVIAYEAKFIGEVTKVTLDWQLDV